MAYKHDKAVKDHNQCVYNGLGFSYCARLTDGDLDMSGFADHFSINSTIYYL